MPPTAELRNETPPRSSFASPRLRTLFVDGAVLSELHPPTRRCFSRHVHDRPYIALLLQGSYQEWFGSKTLEHRPPSVTFYPTGFEHRDEVGRGGGRFLVVELPPRWEAELEGLSDLSEPRCLAGYALLSTLLELWAELRTGTACTFTLESLLGRLLGELETSPRSPRRRPPWLNEVIDHLRADFRTPLSFASLAETIGVHPAHLSRTFRRFIGCTPGRYLQRLRCHYAFERLASDEPATLAQLALDAGFADQSHFTRVFRAITGTSPGALRRCLAESS